MKKYIGTNFDDNEIEKQELVGGELIITSDGMVVTATENVYRFLGVSTTYCFLDFIHQVDADDFISIINTISNSEVQNMLIRVQRVDNSYRWMFITMSVVNTFENEVSDYYKLVMSDAFVVKKKYDAIINKNDYKTVNACENKVFSMDEIYEKAKELSLSENAQFGLIYMFVDEPDKMAKNYGADKLKLILSEIKDVVTGIVSDRGIVGMDADGIYLLINGGKRNSEIRAFLEAVRTQSKWKCFLKYPDISFTLSMGVSRYPQNGRNMDIVIKKEKRAARIATEKGGARFIIYREHLHGEITE